MHQQGETCTQTRLRPSGSAHKVGFRSARGMAGARTEAAHAADRSRFQSRDGDDSIRDDSLTIGKVGCVIGSRKVVASTALLLYVLLSSACTASPSSDSGPGKVAQPGSPSPSQTGSSSSPAPTSSPLPKDDIVTVVASQDDLSMLAEALKASDLSGALRGLGPYTLFAPTNSAFEALGEDTWAALLKPENKQALLTLLASHVVPAAIPSDDVPASKVPSLAGTEVQLSGEAGYIEIEGAPSVRTDMPASNGIVHVVERVAVPQQVDLGSLR